MKPQKSPEELAKMAEMGIWMKDVRETQNMTIPEFGKFIGLKDAEIRLIEAGNHPIDSNTHKLIKRRTGREFGEVLANYVQTHYPEVIEAMEKKENPSPDESIKEPETIDRPFVRVKPEALAARQKVLKERKSSRVPKNMEERKRVSDWLRKEMSRLGLSQKTLADASGVPEYTIRDLVYCHSRLMDEARFKLMKVFSMGEQISEPTPCDEKKYILGEPKPIFVEKAIAQALVFPKSDIICRPTSKKYVLSKEISSGEVKLTLDINFIEGHFSVYQDNYLNIKFLECADIEHCKVMAELIREAVNRAEMELNLLP